VLSLDSCRRLLAHDGRDLSDADVERLRDQMYMLAGVVVPFYEAHRDQPGPAACRQLTQEDRDVIEERAAILEFDGQMPRDVATRLSIEAHFGQPFGPKPPTSTRSRGSDR
jgi:hypothetical protein